MNRDQVVGQMLYEVAQKASGVVAGRVAAGTHQGGAGHRQSLSRRLKVGILSYRKWILWRGEGQGFLEKKRGVENNGGSAAKIGNINQGRFERAIKPPGIFLNLFLIRS